MGIFRRDKSSKSSKQRLDPFEQFDEGISEKSFFADFSATRVANISPTPSESRLVNSPQSEKNSKTAVGKSIRNGFFAKRAAGQYVAILVLAGVAGFTMSKTKVWSYLGSPELVYAYFEVRALDPNGRPIAGAIVKNAGKRVGTTDSFGEWRRYMRVPLGATVPVTLAKKSANEVLYATKNFAVPPEKPEKSEIELRASVQLLAAELNNNLAQTAAQASPNDMMQVNPTTNGKKETAALVSSDRDDTLLPKAKPTTVSLPVSSTNQGVENLVTDHESVWFETNGSPSSALNKEVLPALVQRSREIGLRVDPNSSWKVRLTSLVDKPHKISKDGGGLVMVTSTDGELKGRPREFLRNYQTDARATARGILFVLANHVNKNVTVLRRGERWVATLPKATAEIWRLGPNLTIDGAQSSFLLTREEYSDEKSRGFYLRAGTAEPCAKGLNSCTLKTRSFVENAPVPNWSRLRLKTITSPKEPLRIFVSGYEAHPVGDKLFEYWGLDKSKANVTVIHNGRVVSRLQVLGDVSSPALLGTLNISRR